MIFWVYLYLVCFIIFDIIILIIAIEQIISCITKIAPAVSAGEKQRRAIVDYIAKNYPDFKTALDIGSGFGAMTRSVSEAFPSAKITGVEIMPSPFVYSCVRHVFKKNIKFAFGDVFKFLENRAGNVKDKKNNKGANKKIKIDIDLQNNNFYSQGLGGKKFDIGITYLLAPMMELVQKYSDNFDVLIALDFPLPNRVPDEKIKLHHDAFAQHYLYVYKN